MKAMILAAGRGKRLGQLTQDCPKPLLPVGEKPLIVHIIEKLKAAGIDEIIINTAYLPEVIHNTLGDGTQYGIQITYSDEPEPDGLETAGGILNALPLLSDPFLVVNGDIFTDYNFESLSLDKLSTSNAHLVMVDTPKYKKHSDYIIEQNRLKFSRNNQGLTFGGIALYNKIFFDGYNTCFLPLKPLFDKAITADEITAEYYPGEWHDIGTPESYQIATQSNKASSLFNP